MAGFAIFVPGQGVPGPQGGAKGGKLLWNVQSAQHAKFGGQTKCLHWALQGPMVPCHALVAKWVGGLHVWGLSLPRVGRLGFANVGLLQAWSAKVPKMAHCRPKTANRWLEVPDWPIVLAQRTEARCALFLVLGPPWGQQSPNLQISGPPSRATPSTCGVGADCKACRQPRVPRLVWDGSWC